MPVTPFEYILGFSSILLGLAVSDLAASLHRVLRARARVRFDWLALTAALFVLLSIVQFWWAFYRTGRSAMLAGYGSFLPLVAVLLIMFLLASAALPDEVPPAGLDLADYYAANARYLWGLYTGFVVLGIATAVVAAAGPRLTLNAVVHAELGNTLGAGLAASLALVRRRAYHACLLPLLLFVNVIGWSGLRLA